MQSMMSEASLMKEMTDCYPHFEKFMRMKLNQSMVGTVEYQFFRGRYPHLAESIRLKREMGRLETKLKSEKRRSSRLQIKREINVTKAKLRKEGILKRLHGESKQEAIFRRHFMINALKRHISSLVMRGRATLRKVSAHTRSVMHRNLPPSLFDLKSLERAETGLALREWIQERQKKRRKQKPFSI